MPPLHWFYFEVSDFHIKLVIVKGVDVVFPAEVFNSMESQLSGPGRPLKSHDFVAFSKKCKNITTQHTDMTQIDLKRVKCNL